MVNGDITSLSSAQARATPSWWTHNKCCPHSLLPAIEYSSHVTPWAISRAPHYRLKSIKVFSLITSRTLPKKALHSGKYMTFLKIIHTSMTRYICALAVLFFLNCDGTNNRRSDFKTSSITVYGVTGWSAEWPRESAFVLCGCPSARQQVVTLFQESVIMMTCKIR